MPRYSTKWVGPFPYAIIINLVESKQLLQIEFDSMKMFPISAILEWSEMTNLKFKRDWDLVQISPNVEWAFCFSKKEHFEIFILKWF
jgi:hypothetical protein